MDYDVAFRIFPISGQDLHLLGFSLGDNFYVNSSMAFGARSSCRIFEMFARVMEWAFRKRTNWPFVTHYLDDFFFAHRSYVGCATLMHTFEELCNFVGAPLSSSKTVGPSTCLTFLGLSLDTVSQVVSIPSEKKTEAIILIECFLVFDTRKITVKRLQQITGKLQFVTKGVLVGRAFLRRLYDLLKTVQKVHGVAPNPKHHIKLLAGTIKDLKMWLQFLTNGKDENIIKNREVPFMHFLSSPHGPELFMDAAGAANLGIGFAFREHWGYACWPVVSLVKRDQVLHCLNCAQ